MIKWKSNVTQPNPLRFCTDTGKNLFRPIKASGKYKPATAKYPDIKGC